MPEKESAGIKPEIIVFAGPNGSGKSTITGVAYTKGIRYYINADEIKRSTLCSDMEAAIKAESLREEALQERKDFIFETVLSTERNLNLLRRAKEHGYFIRCIYVLTNSPKVNILRVRARVDDGGHGVPEDKIISRYNKALKLVPELVELCDIMHIYDNTKMPYRIFKKRKDEWFFWTNEFWDKDRILNLVGLRD